MILSNFNYNNYKTWFHHVETVYRWNFAGIRSRRLDFNRLSH